MIAYEQDDASKIIAFIEYSIVDRTGIPCTKGAYCFVEEAWFHKTVKRIGLLKKFLRQELKKYPLVDWIYYKRRKYGDQIRIYDIHKFLGRRTNYGRHTSRIPTTPSSTRGTDDGGKYSRLRKSIAGFVSDTDGVST